MELILILYSGIFQPIITYDGIVCGIWVLFKEEL